MRALATKFDFFSPTSDCSSFSPPSPWSCLAHSHSPSICLHTKQNVCIGRSTRECGSLRRGKAGVGLTRQIIQPPLWHHHIHSDCHPKRMSLLLRTLTNYSREAYCSDTGPSSRGTVSVRGAKSNRIQMEPLYSTELNPTSISSLFQSTFINSNQSGRRASRRHVAPQHSHYKRDKYIGARTLNIKFNYSPSMCATLILNYHSKRLQEILRL